MKLVSLLPGLYSSATFAPHIGADFGGLLDERRILLRQGGKEAFAVVVSSVSLTTSRSEAYRFFTLRRCAVCMRDYLLELPPLQGTRIALQGLTRFFPILG